MGCHGSWVELSFLWVEWNPFNTGAGWQGRDKPYPYYGRECGGVFSFVHSFVRSVRGVEGALLLSIPGGRNAGCWIAVGQAFLDEEVVQWRKNEEEKMTDGEKKYIWPVPDQS